MKMVQAVIREERFDFVRKALEDRGIFGMSVWEIQGRGEQRGISLQSWRGGTYTIELLPKLMVEVVVPDEEAGGVVDTIQKTAYSGKIGDGKIFVLPVETVVRIRTDERFS